MIKPKLYKRRIYHVSAIQITEENKEALLKQFDEHLARGYGGIYYFGYLLRARDYIVVNMSDFTIDGIRSKEDFEHEYEVCGS